MKRAVVLLSGGLDSATTLYIAKKQGFECLCLIFDYGQRHKKEINAAKKVAKQASCSYRVEKIKLAWGGSALLGRGKVIPRYHKHSLNKIPPTYVPARNIIFLSFALSFAEAVGAKAVFIGAHAQDYSGYPDCRPQFLKAFRKMAALGTASGVNKHGIRIIAPLINKNKAGIIRAGMKLGVPYHLTWSCYEGGSKPCGVCDSCYYRAKGFRDSGYRDAFQTNRGTLSKSKGRVSPLKR
ncbi:MAG: 7-cyano-7-deazaguanine synthase QueC [Candidatus Omnitrophica bacterium]|nr:7-cyano-7-deazaguanine synthase QueC [Candidatus Omnitrophota bacterium]